jgi:hypothetical protein
MDASAAGSVVVVVKVGAMAPLGIALVVVAGKERGVAGMILLVREEEEGGEEEEVAVAVVVEEEEVEAVVEAVAVVVVVDVVVVEVVEVVVVVLVVHTGCGRDWTANCAAGSRRPEHEHPGVVDAHASISVRTSAPPHVEPTFSLLHSPKV